MYDKSTAEDHALVVQKRRNFYWIGVVKNNYQQRWRLVIIK